MVKQLKLIHLSRMSAKDLRQVAQSLHQNVLDCMRSILCAARSFGYELDAETKRLEETINAHDETELISPELGARIITAFQTPIIQKTFARRAEFWLLDVYGTYHLQHLTRFTQPDFTPTEEDAIMARIRTTGIITVRYCNRLQAGGGEKNNMLPSAHSNSFLLLIPVVLFRLSFLILSRVA